MSTPAPEGPSFLTTLVRLLAAFGAAAAGNAARRVAATIGGYLVVALLLAVSPRFFTLSGHRALSLAIGDAYASLIVGCVYLFAGLIIALILQARRR